MHFHFEVVDARHRNPEGDPSRPSLEGQSSALAVGEETLGHVDGAFIQGDTLYVQGWAKWRWQEDPINVEVYVRQRALEWKYLTTIVANGYRSDIGNHLFTFGVNTNQLAQTYLSNNNANSPVRTGEIEFWVSESDATASKIRGAIVNVACTPGSNPPCQLF